MKINILNSEGEFIKSLSLYENQAFLQFIGGHEFFISPDTIFFEIKQGPYLGKDKDKKILK